MGTPTPQPLTSQAFLGTGTATPVTPVAPVASSNPAPTTQSITSDAFLGGKPATSPIQDFIKTNFPGIANPLGLWKNTGKAISDSVQQIQKGISEVKSPPVPGDTVGSVVGKGVTGVTDVLAGATSIPLAPVNGLLSTAAQVPVVAHVLDAVKKYVINPVSDKISDYKPLQDFMMKYPQSDEVAANLINIGMNVGGLIGGGKATLPEAPVDETIAPVGPTSATEEVPTPEEVATAQTKKTQQLQGVSDDWSKPGQSNVSGFKDARAILAKDPTITDFIAQQGLNPYEHIDGDGKYSTEASADDLRATAGKMSSDMLRPALQMADYTTPPTSIADIKAQAIKELEGSSDFSDRPPTAANKLAITEKINSELNAIAAEHTDIANPEAKDLDAATLSLEDMHDQKIRYSKNSGYSPVNDPAVNNGATANRAIASAMQHLVEMKAPKDLPVEDFNAYLSKYYKAADYLDSIDLKKAPVSPLTKVARMAAKFAGAKVGGIFGGDIVSEFAGYQIGKALEHMVENLTNPLRDSFLKNLEITNPKAYDQVEAFLKKK